MDSLNDCDISAMESCSLEGSSSVMESLNEDSEENKLEITRNPFDSNLYDKDNFPSIDASVFMESRTPDSRSPAEFRWSIDQIAKLKPADLDMCPNQEYSVTYERKEDEEREQQEVDEYFKNVLLPSPWLENRVDMLKRVTFSPHPPSTRYIQDVDSEDIAMNSCASSNNCSSNSSQSDSDNNNIPGGVNRKSTQQQQPFKEGVVEGIDVCCQTMLTFPTDFDLFGVLNKDFFSYKDESSSSKEVAVSSLRRKLFGQDSASNTPTKRSGIGVGVIPHDNLKINTPSYTTSSPSKAENLKTPSLSKSSETGQSPSLSPLQQNTRNRSPVIIITPDNEHSPPKQASNVGTPAGKPLDISFSTVDVSPIRSCEKSNGGLDLNDDESNYSFLPNVSFDLNATEESVFDSSRAAVKFDSPDISPIKVDERDDFTQSNTGTDSIEIRDINSFQLQSIKESTARNMHAFSGLEELSSIVQSESKQTNDEIVEDRGPLDISELEGAEGEQSSMKETNYSSSEPVDCDCSQEEADCSADLLDITDLDTTKEQKLCNSDSNSNGNDNIENDNDSVETPTFPGLRSKAKVVDSSAEEFVTTPLKGILKHRDFHMSGSSNVSSDYEQDTKFNTERNSGRTRNRILNSLDIDSSDSNSPKNGKLLNVKPIDDLENSDISVKSEEKVEWKWSWRKCEITEATFSDELVYRRALSALRRSRKLTGSFERELFDKENTSPWQHRLKHQLNSTEVASSSASSSNSIQKIGDSAMGDSNVFSEQRSDSGVAGMDWASEPNLLKQVSAVTTPQTPRWRRSVSPLTKFDQLSLHTGQTPLWSQSSKKLPSSRLLTHASSRTSSSLNRSYSQLDRSLNQRYLVTKSHSWPHHKNRPSASPYLSSAPRSRVTPKGQSKKHAFSKNDEYNSLFKSTDLTSLKDFLPSPLK